MDSNTNNSNSNNSNFLDYISLQEAVQLCCYSQEYLSLRARQGKLKAKKIGRNWVITRDWLEDYLKNSRNHKNNKEAIERQALPAGRQELRFWRALARRVLIFPVNDFF